MPATTGMKGAGSYDLHSSPQMSSIQALQDWIAAAVAGLPLPAGVLAQPPDHHPAILRRRPQERSLGVAAVDDHLADEPHPGRLRQLNVSGVSLSERAQQRLRARLGYQVWS